MVTTFNEAIGLVLKHEGGLVDDPADSGGITKYGISKRAYPDIDIKNLTIEKAKEIYRQDYWLKSYADKLPIDIRYIHFDTAINCGLKRAAKILQESIGGIAIDGIIGNQTLSNAPKTNIYKYGIYRLEFYNYLVSKKPSQVKFIKGWTNRVISIIENN